MYKVALVNMPFAAAEVPSIALSQLKAVAEQELRGRLACDVLYLNLDFVNYLGLSLFQMISNSVQANTSGLGDWFFSAAAFPAMADDPEAYLNRHFAEQRTELTQVRGQLVSKRRVVGRFLDSLIPRYQLTAYDLVGFTSMFCQNVGSFALARKLKQLRPDQLVVMGGANCETSMGMVIAKQLPDVDFVFSGPALRSFPRFLAHRLAGEDDDCHRIPGVLSRRKLAALSAAGQCREVGEELPIEIAVPLDYDDYFAAFERKLRGQALKPRVPFETSRGCWWGERSHCTFCGLNGMSMKYRTMPPDAAVNLLQGLFDRYGSRTEEFESVDNILPREYLTDVLPRLATPPHARLFYEIKADLKEHEMAVLEKARVLRIQPGIEALSTGTLKLMKKGTTVFQNLRFLMNCQTYHVIPNWNLLVGFPDEPEAVYEKYHRDIPLLTHLYPPGGVYPVRFDRFSPYFKLAAEYGLKLRPSDFYSMIYPFAREELEDLAYFFRDENFAAAYLVNTARWLAKLRDRVGRWQQLWESGAKLELVVEDGAGVVRDSRGGALLEHRIGATGLRVLGAAARQLKLSQLVSRLEPLPAAEVEQEIQALRGLGLLFEEDGVFMNLVRMPEPVQDGAFGQLPGALRGLPRDHAIPLQSP